MKKSITLGLLSFISACSIISCTNGKEKTPPKDYEEYTIYVSKGGKLPYLEWVKEKKRSGKKEKGDPGSSVKSVSVNEKGELIIELSDGRIINAGKISDAFEERG